MSAFPPAVSVIIPTYNRASILGQTLESVFGQTITPSEVIVVDDGSTDGTAQVVQQLLVKYPDWSSRLRFVQQANQGKSAALNHGLKLVRHDWIAYNDSDDLWLPTKLEQQFATIARFPECGVCFTDSRFVNNPEMNFTAFAQVRKPYRGAAGMIADPLPRVCRPPHGIYMQSVIVHRDIMKRVSGFDTRFWVSQDTDFVFRLARESPFCYVSEALVHVDRRADRKVGLTTEFDRRGLVRIAEAELMFEKWLASVSDGQPAIRRRILSLLRDVRTEAGALHLHSGEYKAARAALMSALRTRFSLTVFAKFFLVSVSPRFATQLWTAYRRIKLFGRLPRLHALPQQ